MLIFWPFCFFARRLDAVTLGCVLNFAPVTGCWLLEAGCSKLEVGAVPCASPGRPQGIAPIKKRYLNSFQFPASSF
jgi:hypothetical protein